MWARFNSTITFNKDVIGEFPQFDCLKEEMQVKYLQLFKMQ